MKPQLTFSSVQSWSWSKFIAHFTLSSTSSFNCTLQICQDKVLTIYFLPSLVKTIGAMWYLICWNWCLSDPTGLGSSYTRNCARGSRVRVLYLADCWLLQSWYRPTFCPSILPFPGAMRELVEIPECPENCSVWN